MLAYEGPTPPTSRVIVSAIGWNEVPLKVPQFVDLIGPKAGGIERGEVLIEYRLNAIGRIEGERRGRAIRIEQAAVLLTVGLERQKHQVVFTLAERVEALPKGAHMLRVVLVPFCVHVNGKEVPQPA